MLCDCEVYEICPSCAPSEPTYAKAAAANNEAARRRAESSSSSYTLKEIEALAGEWVKSQEGDIDMLDWTFSIWLEWLAKREREGLG